MHQPKKGNQYYFGMKAHIGVDADGVLVHTVTTTAANAADITEAANLLHGTEERAFGDAGYTGVAKREEIAKDEVKREVTWYVAARPSKIEKIQDEVLKGLFMQAEGAKASIRSKVEHPFRVIKRQFGNGKVRFKGLAKNTAQIVTYLPC
jgi:IS5 family transposase